jgi:tetratricopeptide (TPR) repeat protein
VISLAAADSRAQQTNAFAAATTAFERGDYRQALGLFQQAHEQGLDSAALHYNIGVCQYRTGAYAQAAATFRTLGERFVELRPLAEYNRGLASLALGRNDDARNAFESARVMGDARLAALASSALAEVRPAAALAAPSALWLGYFDVAAAHDDNVALVDELSLPATASASSASVELLGYVSRRVAARIPLRLDFSGYLVRYADAPEFDQDALRVDMSLDWSAASWRLTAGPYIAKTTLDGDGFEETIGAAFRAARSLNEQLAFDVRVLYDDVDSPSARFSFVRGQRERLRFGLQRRMPGRRLRIGYELEWNDRADPSVSPQRDRVSFGYERRINADWSVDGTLAYRLSRYSGVAAPRDERLDELDVAVRRDLAKGWLLNAEYRWLDNDASVAQFSYRSHRIGIGLSYSF